MRAHQSLEATARQELDGQANDSGLVHKLSIMMENIRGRTAEVTIVLNSYRMPEDSSCRRQLSR